MKRYDIRFDSRIERALSESEVAERFAAGTINRHTQCRVCGTANWLTIDDHLPLLKWGENVHVLRDQSYEALPNAGPHNRARLLEILGAIVFVVAATIGLGVLLPRLLAKPSLPPVGLTRTDHPVREMPAIRESPRLGTQSGSVQVTGRARVEKAIVVPAYPPTATPRSSATSQTIPTRSAPTPQPQRLPAEEVTIPLQEWRRITTRYGTFSIKIVDHGPVTFSVWLNHEFQGRRLDKVKGFETTGTNITPIHRLAGADVYFVDRISVSVGYCVLKIVPRS